MQIFEDISDDIVWRNEQLLIAKTLPYIHNFSESHKEYLIKYSIPTIYAIWEGFVQNSFQVYVRELNKLSLSKNDLCISILAHSVDATFPQLKEYPLDFNKRVKFIFKLDSYFQDDFRISAIINTESNVELEVINRILTRFSLETLPHHPFKNQLKNLLFYRNRIAHGDISVVVNEDNVEEYKQRINDFINLTKTLMDEILKRIQKGFNLDKTHLRRQITY